MSVSECVCARATPERRGEERRREERRRGEDKDHVLEVWGETLMRGDGCFARKEGEDGEERKTEEEGRQQVQNQQ